MRSRRQLSLVVIILLGMLALCSPYVSNLQPCALLDAKAADWLFNLRGPRQPCGAFLIVALDTATCERLPGASYYWGWYYAEAITLLSRSGAKAIVLDLLLEEINQQPVLGSEAELQLSELAIGSYAALGQAIAEARYRRNCPVFLACRFEDGALRLPRPELIEAAGGISSLGFINMKPSQPRDQVVRQFPCLRPIAGADTKSLPSLPSLLAEAMLSGSPDAMSGDCLYPESVFINYIGPAGSYPRYSFIELLDESAGQPGQHERPWKDKAVFIGAWDRPGDLYLTPFRGTEVNARMSGVEILANVADTMYSGNALEPIPATYLIASVMVLLLVCCTGVMYLSTGSSLVVDATLAACVVLLAYWGFNHQLLVFPGTTLVLLAGGSTVCRLSRHRVVEIERNRIARYFRRYVGERPLKHVLDGRSSLAAGELHALAVMFADIRGFTGYASQMPPDSVLRALTTYHDNLSTIIAGHGGWVVKLVGDGALAVFGLSNPGLGQAQSAAAAALEILQDLKPQLGDGAPVLEVGVSLDFGEVIVGNVGSKSKIDFTVIGDAVNTAAHLQEACRDLGRRLLATSDFVNQLPAELASPFTPIGSVAIRGKGTLLLYSIE